MPPVTEAEDVVIVEAGDDEDVAVIAGSDAPADGIAEIQRQLADERAARQRDAAALATSEANRLDAERRAAAATGEARQAATQVQSAELDSIVNALAVAERDVDTLRQQYSAAMSEGDFDKAGEIQVKIGRSTARLVQLEDGKTELERRREAAAAAPAATPAAAATVPQDEQARREAYLATMSPRVATWMRANPRYFDDAKYRDRVIGAHNMAKGRDIAIESDEYFRFIEQQAADTPAASSAAAAVGGRVVDAAAVPAVAEQRQAAAGTVPLGRVAAGAPEYQPAGRVAAAAPSRDAVTPATARGGATAVSLTRAEREAAMELALPGDPDPIKTYARNKLAAQREGRVF